MQKIIIFLYLCALTLLLTIISVAYFYEQNPDFRGFINQNYNSFTPFIRTLISKYASFYDIDMQYLIFILWGIVFISSLIGFFEKPEKPLFYYPFSTFFTVVFCMIATVITIVIYLWPYDTISIGSLFSFYRGSREKYLNDLWYAMNVLTIIYLYFFIINRLHLWIKAEKKILLEKLSARKTSRKKVSNE